MIRNKLAAVNAVVIFLMVMLISSVVWSQQAPTSQGDTRAFFKNIVGEWVGTCEQSTDGKKADNKFFHVVIKQVDANTFNSQFEYYRYDSKAGSPLQIGTSTITTTIGTDGVAKNKISGKGVMLVNNQPKNQENELTEVLKSNGANSLSGDGSGKISVSGMPLGLGKNGKIQSAKSSWNLNGGVLTIDQSIKAGFRALIFTKTFDVQAHYTAKQGSDVALLMAKDTRISGNL